MFSHNIALVKTTSAVVVKEKDGGVIKAAVVIFEPTAGVFLNREGPSFLRLPAPSAWLSRKRQTSRCVSLRFTNGPTGNSRKPSVPIQKVCSANARSGSGTSTFAGSDTRLFPAVGLASMGSGR